MLLNTVIWFLLSVRVLLTLVLALPQLLSTRLQPPANYFSFQLCQVSSQFQFADSISSVPVLCSLHPSHKPAVFSVVPVLGSLYTKFRCVPWYS